MTASTTNRKGAILDTVIVRPCKSDDISEGGIYVPESVQERSNKCVIVSHGAGTKRNPLPFPEECGVGSTCIHVKGAGVETEFNGEKLYIIKSQDILAFLN